MLMGPKAEVITFCNGGIRKMMEDGRDRFEKIFLEIEKVALQLEAKEKEFEQREKQLQHREAQIETERRKLHRNKIMERILYRNIIELEKKLDSKHPYALQEEHMRKKEASQMMRDMTENEDMEVMKQIAAIRQDLKEIKEAMNEMERKSNADLQEARNLLIQSMREGTTGASVGVRKIGELDIKPFRTALKRKFPDEAEEKAVELHSVFENFINNPTCHPFKIIVDKQGDCKKMVDLENGTLKFLKDEYGEEVFDAMTIALNEMNNYNPTGRYTKLELWNFKENRKETLKEGISSILKMWKGQKQKR